MSLSRMDLESRRLQQIIARGGLEIHIATEAELQASIENTLQRWTPNSDIWLFAYGSLIWNPIIQFADRRVGKIYGWHRQFCLWTPLGRGTLDNPGLVLGLDRGGCCQGIVYRIASANIPTELLLLWRREMVVGAYTPRWVKVFDGTQTIEAITFTINRHHFAYAKKLPLPLIAHQLSTAHGALGSAADYLMQTVEGLLSAGIRDTYLLKLRDQVTAMQRSSILKSTHPDLKTYYSLNLIQQSLNSEITSEITVESETGLRANYQT